ncbi:MAG: hypothetical protein OXR73_16080, partial [Myxococcales bacterium]|nr:hypothetical protein [Myxococcales bacterium]
WQAAAKNSRIDHPEIMFRRQGAIEREEVARRLTLPCSCLAVFAVAVSHAFVAEDAFITMRTVDNLLAGYGLRWNVDERVQTFTHPLWLLAVTPVYAVTRSVFASLVSLGLLFSTAAYWLVASRYQERPAILLIFVFGPWISSHAVVKYSTSGLENSLTFLLVAAFAAQLLRDDEPRWGRLGLIAALCAVNRLDTSLLFAPALLWLLVVHRKTVNWHRFLSGFLPLVAWLLFSLVYFGFLFPNTAHAKLPPEIPAELYLRQGLRYLADLLWNDPVAAVFLAADIVAIAVLARTAGSHRRVSRRMAAFGTGAVGYVIYVIVIGGDFLSGRFWAAPVVASIAVCAFAAAPFARQYDKLSTAARALGVVASLAAMVGVHWVTAGRDAIAQDHIVAYPRGRWTLSSGGLGWEANRQAKLFALVGHRARQHARVADNPVSCLNVIGMSGFAAGPSVVIVGRFGIVDPLIARLPPACSQRFKPGHVVRTIPNGYLAARSTGQHAGLEPGLAEYDSLLSLVVSGTLFDKERLTTILGFLWGAYDHHLARYANSQQERCGPGPSPGQPNKHRGKHLP